MTAAFVEMSYRKKAGRPYPFGGLALMSGHVIGSQIATGEPPVVVIGGDVSIYGEVAEFLDWSHASYRAFPIYRWEEMDFRIDREVVGVSVYCVEGRDAVALMMRFAEGCQIEFGQAA